MKILVTGSNGLVGSAIRERAVKHDFFFATRKDADLTDPVSVENLFKNVQPDCVIHTAARVSGVGGHRKNAGDLFYQNTLMNSYIVHFCHKFNVNKLLAFSSVCAMPDNVPVLREDLLHCGQPFATNYAYGYAKRMIDVMISSYRDQYGVSNYTSLILGNVFGCNDLYNLECGHVLPSLIRKVHEAKSGGVLKVWGDGSPLREFIFSRDLAGILMKIVELDEIPPRVLISGDFQVSIREVVEKLCEVAGFSGEVVWETDKPNGQKSRPSDLSLLKSLIDVEYTDFKEALGISYRWYEDNCGRARR